MTWLFCSSIHVIYQCSYVFSFVSFGYRLMQERKIHLQQLHAESQRLLRGQLIRFLSTYYRYIVALNHCLSGNVLFSNYSSLTYPETIDASFKPLPPVNKPISSILEKIRKRKLDVSKK